MTTTFAQVPLAHIVTSRTNPRKWFDPAKLSELAESVKASGVHTPVLLRPLPGSRVEETADLDPRPVYELVSGERRYRASVMADTGTVPAIVRPLSDEEALEIQLTENLQRDDLTALEEAEGYDTLRDRHDPPLSAADIAQRVHKSRTHVYNRLKLLALCTEGRQLLQDGKIEAAVAEQIARIPDTRVQIQALGNVVNAMTGEALSVRAASDLIRRQYMLKLAEAPFTRTEQVPGMETEPACIYCTRRTGADPDLFADMHGADLCLDLGCYRAKVSAHQHAQLEAARASGATIIEGREAREIIPPTADGRIDGYLRLDDPRDAPDKSVRTLRHAIGDLMKAEAMGEILVVDPTSKDAKTVAVIDTATAARLLALKGKQAQADALEQQARTSAKAAEELQQQKDAERFESAWRWRVLTEAWKKINAAEEGMYSLPVDAIRMLARERVPKHPKHAARVADLLGLGKVAPAQALIDWINGHNDPDRALALLMLFEAATNWQQAADLVPVRLMVIAEDHGVAVDVDMVKAEVEAEHRAEIAARKPAKASLPLPPAAQAERGAGDGSKPKGKGKKTPAAPAVPKVGAQEALQGIAAAMQSAEAGADSGPEGADPAGASAGKPDGRATSPDAGASETVPGKRDELVNESTK